MDAGSLLMQNWLGWQRAFRQEFQADEVNLNPPYGEKNKGNLNLFPGRSARHSVCLNSPLNGREWLGLVFVISEAIKIGKVAVSNCFSFFFWNKFFFFLAFI